LYVNIINTIKYIFYIKLGELSEFWTALESFKTDSGVIPVPFHQIPVIPADSGPIPVDSGAIPPESGGITGFQTESVGH